MNTANLRDYGYFDTAFLPEYSCNLVSIYIYGTLHELENVMNMSSEQLCTVEQCIHVIQLGVSEHSYQ